MEFKEKIERLGALMGGGQYEEAMALAAEIKAECKTEEQRMELARFVGGEVKSLDAEVGELRRDALALQLGEAADMLNLTYIAKKYFHRSHAWLSQRLHGNVVNGKACKFTAEELDTFNHALRDMSARLGALTLSY